MKTASTKHFSAAPLCLAILPLIFSPMAFADFQYTETTQITGGSALSMMKMAATFSKAARQAGEPVTSEVLVKGNRMARISPDTTQITDLDRETITTIDNTRHEYSVLTFEQMREQIQKAMQDAQKHQQKSKTQAPPPSNADMTFDVHVRKTGATKQVSGIKGRRSHHDHDRSGHGQDQRANRRHGHHQRHVDGPGHRRL